MKSGLSRLLSNEDIGLPVIRANNINNGNLDLVNDIKYWYVNDPQGANTRNYLVHKSDILVNFINSEAKMGTATIVTIEPIRDTIYTTNVLKLKTNENNNPYFIFSLTMTGSYDKYVKIITKPAVNQASFTTVDFKKYEFFAPKLEEQTRIGNLFKQLDDTIALHQRQLDNYKQLKKSMIQKIFDQELRFKDVDGNDYPKWKRGTLGEISEIIMGQSPDSANYTSNEQDTVLIQGNADLNGGKITPRIYTTQITKTCEAGDIILTVRAPVGDLAIANTRACIGRGVCAIKGDPYIFHYLEMIRDTDGWRKIIQGSTFESINSNDVKDLLIDVPSSEERKKIAIFLSALNKKVENQENMITLLKEQKKGFMHQLFI
ncbi:restriction endonuclease type i hsds [Trichococcus palustris]|uniref:Restriction endonuclease type i hsds n=2 Tax=Trichococcus palustris TaxID=140314 RepID=A0A143YCS7_9LACT|nr:restriction endonuclease type i hsds [Trichococcus palustris]SFK56518.1 Type I restriction modification DNA specificity domain-containing protein [Trichococcus palustris]